MTNCLVVIRNKKLNIDYGALRSLMRVFSGACYYFDKITAVAFDDPKLISGQLNECRSGYENTVVLCPAEQCKAVAEYLQKIYCSSFDGRIYINVEGASVLLGTIEESISFAEKCVVFLNDKYGVKYDKLYVKCVSASPQTVYGAIDRARALCKDAAFAVYDEFGDQTIEISYSSNTPKMSADAVVRAIVSALEEHVYALENISLEERLYDLLKLRRMKISVAESFTGGGIASRLVSVPGISEVYVEGLNTYANSSKRNRLGVDEFTLKQFGAVSDNTAYEMAEGLLKTGMCDVAISTTGIAGPKSDNTSKPVGLAYIGVGAGDRVKVYKFNYKGDRESITRTAINDALFLAYKSLK